MARPLPILLLAFGVAFASGGWHGFIGGLCAGIALWLATEEP